MEVDRLPPYKGCAAHRAQTNCRSTHTRNRCRVFRPPRRSVQYASVSRFVNPKVNYAQAKLRGKSKEGGRSPLLGRFKGDCQEGRVPTRIQRSDSCGKRRNNGMDDACPPLAADRMRDVEFVPTQLHLDDSFFRPSTALSFSYEKESGVENLPFLARQKRMGRRRRALCLAKEKGTEQAYDQINQQNR